MKKSIFLFFAAILCAMSVSAKVIYFKPNSNWAAANANFYAHVWGGSGATSPVKFTPVATDPDVYEAEVGTHTSIIFLRHDPAKTDAQVQSNMWDLWNRMGNLSIPTEGNNCCAINDGEWSQEKDDASSHVTWSTYTPPTEVVIPDRYITGTIAGGWNANDVKMTYDEATETYSHTFTAVAADELHQFKVTDGTWSKNWGGDAVSPAIEGVTTGSDGNVAFTLSVGGDVTITFKDSKIQLTTTGSFTPVETFDYYVVGSFNGWNTADAAYGMTKEGDVYKKEVTFAKDAQFKVCDGTWGAAWGAQNLGDNKYKELDGTDNIVMKEEKTFTIIFNPAQNLLTFEGLTEEAPEPTFDYYITGSFNGNNPKKAENGMTLDGTVYKATVTLAAGDNTLKVTDGTWEKTWGANELGAAYEEVSNPNDYNNIKITLAAEKSITVIFDATAGKITFEGLTETETETLVYYVEVPEGTEDCYIAGQMNEWAFQRMTQVDATHWTITYDNVLETTEYKYACQASWDYVEKDKDGNDLADNRTWKENDKVENWGKPVIVTYQLKGVGGWEQPGIELVQNPGNDKEYMLTCQAISATDAIKVVRLEDGVIKDYYGNGTVKDGVTVDVSYDGEANIKLPEGKYNFYFDTNEPDKKLWIAAATDCGPATITLTTGNNDDVIAANIGNTVNVVIERSFTANDGFYTLCVPFNMDPSVIGKAYYLGNDIKKHVSGEGIDIELVEETYMLSAGVPYLVLPKANMSELVVENVTIESDPASGQNITSSEELNVQIFFEGFYSASGQTNGTTQYYVGNNGYLYNEVVDIRGLCGLFTITDKNGAPLNVRARVVTREDEATGFENIVAPEGQAMKVIENGQLIIIRGNEKFNAQGQKL